MAQTPRGRGRDACLLGMQLGESNDTCTTGTLGTIRRNPATGKLQICRL